MSVTKYQIFLKTVERGSFTAAAREMNFTQSGVSHAISSLEEELGVTLLVRSHGGVTPTADGRALMPYFEEMCAMQHRLEQHAADLRGLETGLVRVATFTSVSEKWLPGDTEDVSGAVSPHRVRAAALQLQQRDLRLGAPGARRTAGSSPAHPGGRSIWTAGFCSGISGRSSCPAIIPWRGGSPSAGGAGPVSHDIAGRGDDYEIQAIFDHYGIQPQVQYTVQQDQTILAMVSGGLGISIMEELMLYHCAYPLAASTLPKVFHRDIGICVKDKNALSHSTQVFIDHVRRWGCKTSGGVERAPASRAITEYATKRRFPPSV